MRVSNLNRDKQIYAIPAARFAEELGKRMVLNSVTVGFFTAFTTLLTREAVRKGSSGLCAVNFPRTQPESFRSGI